MIAVYYRELLLLRRRLGRMVASMAVSPFLYLTAFGYLMGRDVRVDGMPYVTFLVPGLVAMASMTHAFSISSDINIARFYCHVFEEIQAAPVSAAGYVAGEVLAGMTRALIAVLTILVLGALYGVWMACGAWFWLAVLLNAWVFASLAVCLAMVIRSHGDQALLSSFVITPMAFLGGTFFPLDRAPPMVARILSFLPLTHATRAIRAAALERTPSSGACFMLLLVGGAIFLLATWLVGKARD